MTKLLCACAVSLILLSCGGKEAALTQTHLPSKEYKFVRLDTARVPLKSLFYVPVYSHIYILTGERTVLAAATLSVRNTTFADTLYITRIDYFGSQGKLLKRYIDKPLQLDPMNALEFVVEESEAEGGAGANFIVECRSKEGAADPLIQAVMISTYNASGISFTTNAVKIQSPN